MLLLIDVIYVNGTVLTMDTRATVAQAVAVRGAEIAAVGTNADIRKLAGPQTRVADLRGRTMLPGFYSPHDHFPQLGILRVAQVDLNSPPIGSMETIGDVLEALRARARQTPAGQWIVGRGYDDTLLREKRHPDRRDLDRVSTSHPIVIIHTSGHLSAANSRALEIAGVTRDTPQPRGGRIRKDPATGEPTGVFEETNVVQRLAPKPGEKQRREAMRWADRYYVERGVTTAVMAGSGAPPAELAAAIQCGDVRLRIVAMLSPAARETTAGDTYPGVPRDRLHLTAAKIWHDGSIQGYTGFLSAPYYKPLEGQADARGYPAQTREELTRTVVMLHRAGRQIAIHANGDAAIDNVLYAYAEAQRQFPRTDARHRIEHCQTAREDQLDRMKELGVTPSFFVGHVFYWGDRHRDIFLGPQRAARISPLASALRRGIRFTTHDDTPVTPVNPLLDVWCSVNRITRDGKPLGPEFSIPALEALRAVTSEAAWQNFEEGRKGSIGPGKLADFVVLDRNPLSAPPAEIRGIRVLETIIGGSSVYRAAPLD
ncbi:MAG: amidohydrolase [Bryobacteraceae bacterium]